MPLSPSDPPISTPTEPAPGDYTQPPTETPPTGKVTMVLMIICAAIAIWSSLGNNVARMAPFFISLWPSDSPQSFSEVRAGQVWRLFTPAFLHFGPAHLIFNMLGLQSLGTVVETRNGRGFYLVLIAILAVTTDLAQYYASGPHFGGMSGVLYGLFGYVWLRSICDHNSGFRMPRETVIVGVGWLLLCYVGVLGPIANVAHTTGLLLGAFWGIVSGRMAVRRQTARSF